jgi:hypothetical protein
LGWFKKKSLQMNGANFSGIDSHSKAEEQDLHLTVAAVSVFRVHCLTGRRAGEFDHSAFSANAICWSTRA